MTEPYTIKRPKTQLPLIFDSPHSGSTYPKDFEYACDLETLRRAEDIYVDELFSSVPKHGGTLLIANFPRTYIDPNRAEDDIDPKILKGRWKHGGINPSIKSEAGIGLIRRQLNRTMPLYKKKLSGEEIYARLEKYYHPYHNALRDLIEKTHAKFGQIWHINCHSMPSATAFPKHPHAMIGNTIKPIDFCLGDSDGTTCSSDFRNSLRDFIRNLGYSVSINDPFKGVELVTKYSAPTRGFHSMQIEINQALYMDEDNGKKNENFKNLKADIEKIVTFCTAYVQGEMAIQTIEEKT